MSTQHQENGRLDGWKAVSDYLGWHIRTVMRWEQQRGLPIHRVPGGQRHAVFAFRLELDEWLKSGRDDENTLGEDPEFSPATFPMDRPTFGAPSMGLLHPSSLRNAGQAIQNSNPWKNQRRIIWGATGIALLLLLGYAVRTLAFPPQIEFTSVVQLTHDGTSKEGLVTDGKTIFFGEHQGSQIVLVSASASGGPIRAISTSFLKVIPLDISADGKRLLVVAWEGFEVDRSLWILPTQGGKPVRVGAVQCHAAKWSHDGRRIAFIARNAIYLTDDQGMSPLQIESFSVTPRRIAWSVDDRHLRFDLVDRKNDTFSIWELTLSDENRPQISSLISLHSPLNGCWSRTMTLDKDARSFANGGPCGSESIYLLERRHQFWSSQFDFRQTNSAVGNVEDLALDQSEKKVYTIGEFAASQSVPDRVELFRFNVRSREFMPFLPGVNASEVDFARNSSLITYVRFPEQTLWVSQPDGSGARQIELPTGHHELPRWSPDGKWIAVMAQTHGRPWRILLVPSVGGVPKDASSGTDNQGAPTWSPDGKSLVYGNVECQEAGNCAIHKIELSTGNVNMIPDSEGLATARLSPDGKYIAALNPTEHDVMVYDISKQKWRKLIDGMTGNDLSWSQDSRYVYASKSAGANPEIIRISLAEAKTETEVDLRSFAALSGQIGPWFTLAPDGSVVFSRQVSGKEIYSLTYAEK